jgi:hypothetical protein
MSPCFTLTDDNRYALGPSAQRIPSSQQLSQSASLMTVSMSMIDCGALLSRARVCCQSSSFRRPSPAALPSEASELLPELLELSARLVRREHGACRDVIEYGARAVRAGLTTKKSEQRSALITVRFDTTTPGVLAIHPSYARCGFTRSESDSNSVSDRESRVQCWRACGRREGNRQGAKIAKVFFCWCAADTARHGRRDLRERGVRGAVSRPDARSSGPGKGVRHLAVHPLRACCGSRFSRAPRRFSRAPSAGRRRIARRGDAVGGNRAGTARAWCARNRWARRAGSSGR